MTAAYLKIAWRNFTKHLGISTINLAGLALGVACLLLAVVFWLDERGFDGFHAKKDQLFRITMSMKNSADEPSQTIGGTRQAHAAPFAAAAPEVKKWVRLLGGDVRGDVRVGEKVMNLQLLFADETFFELFDFPLLAGDSATVLHDINSCVLTEKSALALFGTTDVVGRFLDQDNSPSQEKIGDKPMMVAAVAKNPPSNSSIQFDILMPMRYLQLSFLDEAWVGGYLGTYVLLDKKADLKAVSAKFDSVFAEKAAPELSKMAYDPQVRFGLQPLNDIHLNSYLGGNGWHEGGTVGESKAIYSNLFLLVALFVFGMAAINFINITLASSLSRVKEVAVRKLNGGSRWSVFRQFLGESSLVCAVAFCLAAVLVFAVLPEFEALVGRKMNIGLDIRSAASLLLLFFAITSLSATYPAFLMSNFQPAETLSSRSRPRAQTFSGKVLVVVQFSLAIFLVVAATVFWKQLQFVEEKDLGYAPELVIRSNINGDVDYESIKTRLKNEVAQHDFFESLAFAGDFSAWSQGTETGVNGQTLKAAYQSADENFVEALGIPLIEGRNFSSPTNREVLVNEAFVKAAGLEDPIGASVQMEANAEEKQPPHQIVGILKDFHFESLHKPIQPLAIWHQPWHEGGIYLKINPLHREKAVKTFEKIYKSAMPTASFEWHFLDELVATGYVREQRFQMIIGASAGLALVICGLGMFGLAHFAAQRRTKEIGIRKVLGATTASIFGMLSKDFLKLVIGALVIASPLAWYFMNKWLQGFAYRIDIQWTVFFLAGAMAVAVAFLTVSFQSVKAALANPSDSLRSE
jgi:putative ABC transport system permease protein